VGSPLGRTLRVRLRTAPFTPAGRDFRAGGGGRCRGRARGVREEAPDSARTAIDLAPFTPPWYPTVLASASFVGEQYESVLDVVEPLFTAGTADPEGMLLLAASQEALGMKRNARATLAEIRLRHPSLDLHDAVRAHPFVDRRVGERWIGLIEAIDWTA